MRKVFNILYNNKYVQVIQLTLCAPFLSHLPIVCQAFGAKSWWSGWCGIGVLVQVFVKSTQFQTAGFRWKLHHQRKKKQKNTRTQMCMQRPVMIPGSCSIILHPVNDQHKTSGTPSVLQNKQLIVDKYQQYWYPDWDLCGFASINLFHANVELIRRFFSVFNNVDKDGFICH